MGSCTNNVCVRMSTYTKAKTDLPVWLLMWFIIATILSPMGDTHCIGTIHMHKALLHPCILGCPFSAAGVAEKFPPG